MRELGGFGWVLAVVMTASCGAADGEDFDTPEAADSASDTVEQALVLGTPPDLTVLIDRAQTCRSGDAYAYMTVKNLGGSYAAPSVLEVNYGPAGSTSWSGPMNVSVPGLRPYGSQSVQLNVRSQPRVRATADAKGRVTESNEANNGATLDCDAPVYVVAPDAAAGEGAP